MDFEGWMITGLRAKGDVGTPSVRGGVPQAAWAEGGSTWETKFGTWMCSHARVGCAELDRLVWSERWRTVQQGRPRRYFVRHRVLRPVPKVELSNVLGKLALRKCAEYLVREAHSRQGGHLVLFIVSACELLRRKSVMWW